MRGHSPARVSPFGHLRLLRVHTPHRSFSQCTTSFFGNWRLGIPRMPSVAYPTCDTEKLMFLRLPLAIHLLMCPEFAPRGCGQVPLPAPTGCLLVVGCWLLVVGCWCLVVGDSVGSARAQSPLLSSQLMTDNCLLPPWRRGDSNP